MALVAVCSVSLAPASAFAINQDVDQGVEHNYGNENGSGKVHGDGGQSDEHGAAITMA